MDSDGNGTTDMEIRVAGLHGLVEDDFLVHECATLVERPAIVPGSFDDAFLELPEAVVISVMNADGNNLL